MANYCCTVRTNYFRVKDVDEFKAFMENVKGCEDTVDVWVETNKNNETFCGFGCYGGIAGIEIEDDEGGYLEDDYDAFIDGLQRHVADDDAIIILESGNEKLNYVVGCAIVITSDDYRYLDIGDVAVHHARTTLGNKNWKTQLSY